MPTSSPATSALAGARSTADTPRVNRNLRQLRISSTKENRMRSGVPSLALVLVGLVLIPLGILAGGSLSILALGVACLVVASALEVVAQRR